MMGKVLYIGNRSGKVKTKSPYKVESSPAKINKLLRELKRNGHLTKKEEVYWAKEDPVEEGD